MFKKIVGLIFLIVGLSGIAFSIGGTIISRDVVSSLEQGLDGTLKLTSESLDTVNDTLVLTKSMLGSVSTGLDTVSETADNVAQALYDSQPLLDQVSEVAAGEVPDSLVAIQLAIPDVATAASAIDDALILLDKFQFERRVLGVPFRFDLGINYDPSLPLDDTVLRLGESLNGLPEGLRALDANLALANENLLTIGANVEKIADDLTVVNNDMGEVEPLLDEYIRLVTETNDLIRQTRAGLANQLETARLVITVLFVWIGLSQIAPLYLAIELLRSEAVSTNEADPDR